VTGSKNSKWLDSFQTVLIRCTWRKDRTGDEQMGVVLDGVLVSEMGLVKGYDTHKDVLHRGVHRMTSERRRGVKLALKLALLGTVEELSTFLQNIKNYIPSHTSQRPEPSMASKEPPLLQQN